MALRAQRRLVGSDWVRMMAPSGTKKMAASAAGSTVFQSARRKAGGKEGQRQHEIGGAEHGDGDRRSEDGAGDGNGDQRAAEAGKAAHEPGKGQGDEQGGKRQGIGKNRHGPSLGNKAAFLNGPNRFVDAAHDQAAAVSGSGVSTRLRPLRLAA